MKKLLLFISIIIAVASCSNSGNKAGNSHQGIQIPEADKKAHLMNMANGFWYGIDFSDSTLFEQEQQFMPAFAQWADMALALYYEYGEIVSKTPVELTMNNSKALVWLMNIADECFRNPNSPFRCEELYIPMLEAAINSNADELYKEVYQERLAKALKNRKGTAAADFSYITENGETGTLHGIHAKHTILYFFNPDCHDCARVSEIIGNDSTIREMAGSKQLSVLALYPDKDMTAWNKHFGKWPKEWITARYADLAEKEKYDLPAIPNIYLLDENKTVVLKDAAIEEIIDHLNSRTK
ncbi:MAG: DUF5106 domain-containing protein [Muribaculaceae bacterium]|nr:DUF5106 domain-containing protein [Muribaculaceae bacterium]